MWDEFLRENSETIKQIIDSCQTEQGTSLAISLIRNAARVLAPSDALGAIDKIVRLSTGDRTMTGAVHTRPEDARFMCGLALQEYRKQVTDGVLPVVMDPACGPGIFLREMYGELIGAAHGQTEEQVISHILGVDISPVAVEAACASLAIVSGRTDQADYFRERIRRDDFLLSDYSGYDIVIGNPPYVRNQHIGPAYRHDVMENLALYYPSDTLKNLSAASDLYVYFILKGLAVLREGGVLCFIVPNVWLDSAYGYELRKVLSESARVVGVFEYRNSRKFSDASINSSIILAVHEKPSPDAEIRFVSIGASDDREDCQGPGVSVKQSEALNRPACGVYLRSPDIYRVIMEKAGDLLSPLERFCKVRRGMTTGANEFFYPSAEQIAAFGIEKEFLLPCIKGPQDCRRIVVTSPVSFVFSCREAREALRGTGALRYIEWGEEQGFQHRPSCAIRSNWWALPYQRTPDIAWIKAVDRIHRHSRLKAPMLVDQRLYAVYCENVVSFNLVINSSLVFLLREIYGRTSLGEGALDASVADIRMLPVPDPDIIPHDAALEMESRLAKRDILPAHPEVSMPDRRELDNLVFRSIGLSEGEGQAVCEELVRLVGSRLARARTVPLY